MRQTMASNNGIKQWHQKMASNNGIRQWHQTMASDNGTKQWHQTMAPNNGIRQWHQAFFFLSFFLSFFLPFSNFWSLTALSGVGFLYIPFFLLLLQLHQAMVTDNGIKQWHQTMASNNGIKQWHQTMASNNGIKQYKYSARPAKMYHLLKKKYIQHTYVFELYKLNVYIPLKN